MHNRDVLAILCKRGTKKRKAYMLARRELVKIIYNNILQVRTCDVDSYLWTWKNGYNKLLNDKKQVILQCIII